MLDFPPPEIQHVLGCRPSRYGLVQGECNMVLTLDPQLAAALNEMVRQQGIPAKTLAIKVLRDRFLGPARVAEPRDDWERRRRAVAADCGVSMPDAALI